MALAIHELARRHPIREEDVDAFIRRHTFPIVEGRAATFIYHGDAESVHLRHFVFGLPSTVPFTRVRGSNLWFHVMELPPKSRMEYKIEVVHDGRNNWIRDPLNPKEASDPFGANSVCCGDGYETPDWIYEDPEARKGELEERTFQETPFGEPRKIGLYLPARFRRTRRYPLMIVHDGGDYLHFARMRTVLDNLIHRGDVTPLVVAFSYPGSRMTEYPADPRHARFLAKTVVPALEKELPLYATPAHRGLMGASFGGVASLYTAWRYSGFFGRLLLQSGSFAFTDIGVHKRGPAFDPVVKFVNTFREKPGRPSERVYVSCGTYESLIYENRSMVPLLQATGMDVKYSEARDGHNWENWRDRLREGLSWLFPGTLWMVYE